MNTKTRLLSVLLLASVAVGIASTAAAHHSFAALYDANKPIRLVGKLTKIDWTNPHSYFHLDVKGSDEVHSEQLDELAADAGMDDVPGGGGSHVVARLDARSQAEHGREVEVVLDASQIKLFDPDGGRTLTAKH